jgi:hypothetical protein
MVAHTPGKPDEIICCWTYGKGKQSREELERRRIPFDTREAKEGERLPDPEPCDKCKTEIELHRSIVQAGGVYFKCKGCAITGVLRAESELAKMVREHSGIAAPNPVGFEFERCDQHTITEG